MRIKDVMWKMTDSAVGMKPKFRVYCSQCMMNHFEKLYVATMVDADILDSVDMLDVWRLTLLKLRDGFFNMTLRECFCSPLPTIGIKAHHNDMHYKCAKSYGCDQVKVFGVPTDKEYYVELMKRRSGIQRIQPVEDWDKDEDIKKQLKSMGYL